MLLRREELERLAPRPAADKARAAVWDGYVDALTSAEGAAALADTASVTTSLRLAHALATMCGETGGFQILWENMSYRAERIVDVFGVGRHSAAITPAEAKGLAGNAYALAERVYGLGNPKKAHELGNREPGDGYKYRGLGIGQTTGRDAHERYAAAIGCSIEDLALFINTIKAFALEWSAGRCNERADADDVLGVRRIWNGGYNGIEHVRAYLAKAKKLWPAESEQPKDQVGLGDAGEHVEDIQAHLTEKGFPVGAIDGKFGSLTERQVGAFQVAHGLTGTGKVDQATWTLLCEAAPPPEAVPGRENLDAKTLAERGSKTVKAGMSIKRWGWISLVLGLGQGADALTGIGMVEVVLTNAEKAAGLAGRASALLGTLISVRTLVTAGCLIAGAIFLRWGANLVAERLASAKAGNLTK